MTPPLSLKTSSAIFTLRPTLREAIIEGSREIGIPALVSTLSICIVFAPIFLLRGTPKYLFSPLALAVVFSMLASYSSAEPWCRSCLGSLCPATFIPAARATIMAEDRSIKRVETGQRLRENPSGL